MATAVVFDFAGVLFHWQPRALLRQVLPQRAPDEASAAHWAAQIFQGYAGDWADFDRGTIGATGLAERIAARTGLATDEVAAVIDAVPPALQPIAGTVALLRQLHAAGRPLYFLSNMPGPYAEHLLREHDFLQLFDDGVFSARVRLIKPDPAIFELAARRFGRAPDELLFLDDVAANVEAARAARWQAVQFTDPAGARAALREAALLAD